MHVAVCFLYIDLFCQIIDKMYKCSKSGSDPLLPNFIIYPMIIFARCVLTLSFLQGIHDCVYHKLVNGSEQPPFHTKISGLILPATEQLNWEDCTFLQHLLIYVWSMLDG